MGRDGRSNGDGVARERIVVMDAEDSRDFAVWEAGSEVPGEEERVDVGVGAVVGRCEGCGLGYELLDVGGAGDVAGSCGDCGGSLYLLDGFSVEGSGFADRYEEGFVAGYEAGWDGCVALWAQVAHAEELAVDGGPPLELLLDMDLDELEALYAEMEAGS